MKKNDIIPCLLAILIFAAGWFGGRYFKKCPGIVYSDTNTNIKYVQVPVHDTFRFSLPANTVYIPEPKSKATAPVVIYKTDSFFSDAEYFTSIDTLRHGDIFAALADTGNCTGILRRKYIFGGTLKEKVIEKTVTNFTERPYPLFTFFAGPSLHFDSRFGIYDVGPALGVNIRNRYLFNYNYQLNKGSHNFILQTKIY